MNTLFKKYCFHTCMFVLLASLQLKDPSINYILIYKLFVNHLFMITIVY